MGKIKSEDGHPDCHVKLKNQTNRRDSNLCCVQFSVKVKIIIYWLSTFYIIL